MKRIIFIALISMFVLCACNQSNEVEANTETTKADVELLPREEILLNFLTKMYTISDISEYEVYLDKFDEYLQEENISKLSFGYDEMCTDDGLGNVLGNRLHILYREASLAGDFVMRMNKVDYSQTFDEKADATILKKYRTVGYEFAIELQIEYSDGEIENIVEEGFVNLKNIDGEWKIDLFQLKEFKEFWLKFTMPN